MVEAGPDSLSEPVSPEFKIREDQLRQATFYQLRALALTKSKRPSEPGQGDLYIQYWSNKNYPSRTGSTDYEVKYFENIVDGVGDNSFCLVNVTDSSNSREPSVYDIDASYFGPIDPIIKSADLLGTNNYERLLHLNSDVESELIAEAIPPYDGYKSEKLATRIGLATEVMRESDEPTKRGCSIAPGDLITDAKFEGYVEFNGTFDQPSINLYDSEPKDENQEPHTIIIADTNFKDIYIKQGDRQNLANANQSRQAESIMKFAVMKIMNVRQVNRYSVEFKSKGSKSDV